MKLEAKEMYWLDTDSGTTDLCAHGNVYFELDNKVLMNGSESVTVSATAVFLLRTLEKDHTIDKPLFDAMFQCCGHSMFPCDSEYGYYILSGACFNKDFEVRHKSDGIVQISDESGIKVSQLSLKEWRQAVYQFSSTVLDFYKASLPKDLSSRDDEEIECFNLFIKEWNQRHQSAMTDNK